MFVYFFRLVACARAKLIGLTMTSEFEFNYMTSQFEFNYEKTIQAIQAKTRTLCETGDYDAMETLIVSHQFDPIVWQIAMSNACASGNLDMLKFLLTMRNFYTTSDHTEAVQEAKRHGHTDMVNFLIRLIKNLDFRE